MAVQGLETALPAETEALLTGFGFDAELFALHKTELQQGRFGLERNRVAGQVAPLEAGDLIPWPPADSERRRQLTELGLDAIDAGEVAVLVLNGGMATRFGGRVKGIVEVIDGQSFLALRLGQIAAMCQAVTVFVMNSFATDTATREHINNHGGLGIDSQRLHYLTQGVSLRLTPEGDIFSGADGAPSPYAPGHGDVFDLLAASVDFARFVEAGGRCVMMANVDNLGATLSPIVVGAHVRSGRAATVEVAPRHPGDGGGAPVRLNGRLEILEGFRFPLDFDTAQLTVLNTNTLVVDVRAITSEPPLRWFRADKQVDGRPAVQFERLMGEITCFVDAAFLEVPREGPEGRFLPVKKPEDLAAMQDLVRMRLQRG